MVGGFLDLPGSKSGSQTGPTDSHSGEGCWPGDLTTSPSKATTDGLRRMAANYGSEGPRREDYALSDRSGDSQINNAGTVSDFRVRARPAGSDAIAARIRMAWKR
jgi:hypothetical protein